MIILCSCDNKAAGQNEPEICKGVIERTFGKQVSERFVFCYQTSGSDDYYSVAVEDNRIKVEGSSVSAMTRGAYSYLRDEIQMIASWSGTRSNMPENLDPYSGKANSLFKYRYYLNSVTHGYTMPYWDWERWEKELDWMALHGLNMPLIPGAHEAILKRVFEKTGLSDDEVLDYFSGPAHFPWNRMGNIGGWDGPPPDTFFEKQIELTHLMLNRMKELNMHPIVYAFAGFVPKGISRLYPDEEVRELGWGGFEERVHILAPGSDLFLEIGELYIREWEKEFGKAEFYLADSFNEMDVPLTGNREKDVQELAAYGLSVYEPIKNASPDAVWVMQGWTFPYHRDKEGKLFWTPERLNAMMSGVPDDKLLILDMANEYNALFWKIDYSWEMYEGFFGKQWIYSFIPNMGGKVPLNGVLDFYASAPQEAIDYKKKNNLVGFGFAPEGIENNEVIYELLSDWPWQDSKIEPEAWLENYCMARYGAYPDNMKDSWKLLRSSCLGTFTDHPRFKYQFRPPAKHGKSVHNSEDFDNAVRLFLSYRDKVGDEALYKYDAIELGAQFLGNRIDELLTEALAMKDIQNSAGKFDEAFSLMEASDRLLASHPNHRLDNWVELARGYGDNESEKLYYESNAKRLITTWGGGVNDYSARMWNGLIGTYYLERWKLWFKAMLDGTEFDMLAWEEEWIRTPYVNESVPYKDPLKELDSLISKY